METNEEIKTVPEEDKDISKPPLEEENVLSESDKRAKFYEACYRLGEAKTIQELKAAEQMFLQLEGYADCDKRLEQCQEKLSELEEQKAREDAAEAQRLERLRDKYIELRDEAKRSERILRKREAASKLTEISEKLMHEEYAKIEGAQDYAREFAATSKRLLQEFEIRKRFEKISSIVAILLQVAAAVIYILAFVKTGGSFKPLVPLAICDCIMFSSFLMGYMCESGSGAYASLVAAFGFILTLIATIMLCIINKLKLGLAGYAAMLVLPILIGFFVAIIMGLIWLRIVAKVEKGKNARK